MASNLMIGKYFIVFAQRFTQIENSDLKNKQ